MSDWTKSTWGAVVELQYGRALGASERLAAGPTRVYGTNGPIGWTSTSQSDGPGVIIGRKGAYRGVHYSPGPFWVIDTAYYVTPRVPMDMRWASYAIRPDDIAAIGSGSAIPSTSREDFYALPVLLPGLDEQRAIADVLGALDDKIAANDAILGTQSALADACFMQALALGGDRVALGELAEFLNRRRVPLSSREREARIGAVPYYGAASRLGFVDEALFDEPLLLVGEDGTVVRDGGSPVTQYIWGPAWVNNHAHVLRGRGISTELLWVALRQSNVAHLVTGAVQPKLSMGNLRTLEVLLPSSRGELERRVQAFVGYERALVEESSRLASTRTGLLPLLLSGKVRVRDAEKKVEEVL
ncbi:restriction endonuclease subunit S [Cellulomonas alba]|uniref:Restriction endonuclease subunit S n=1 Tax=Cellulomonas alba TaxID=3053467 RepID=A0ABT7SDK9_9CELL|nr:restriction endonuclease subunit S [Cellulomonas alba]MDM7853652.1 restriction endonuclease subunit S [Cellulomonas alba]